MSLPIVLLLLSGVVAVLTQIAKYLAEKAGPAWSAEVPQVVAAVIASLMLLAKDFLPPYLQLFVGAVISNLGMPLSAALLAGGSFVIHNLAGIVAGLLALLPKRK